MQDITLTIEADDNPQWLVDSLYAVHPDMKSHTGVLMSNDVCTRLQATRN